MSGECLIFVTCENDRDMYEFRFADVARVARKVIGNWYVLFTLLSLWRGVEGGAELLIDVGERFGRVLADLDGNLVWESRIRCGER